MGRKLRGFQLLEAKERGVGLSALESLSVFSGLGVTVDCNKLEKPTG